MLTRAGIASKVPGAEKLYGQVGQDFRKFIIPPLSDIGRRLTGRSGSGVGVDVAGRYALPKTKPSAVTKRGPRGPVNIDSPKQMPLPLSGGRNTGGISATERAQLPPRPTTPSGTNQEVIKRSLIPPLGKGSKEWRDKFGAKGVYSPPHLTEKAGSKILTHIPRPSTGKGRKDLGEPWYINSKTGELYKFHYGSGALDRGFYNITGRKTSTYGAPGRERSYVPNYVRDYLRKNTPTTPKSEGGIPSTTTGRGTKSYMDTVRKPKLTERQANRRRYIQQQIYTMESMRRQGEATKWDMAKLSRLQKELEALNKLLK